MAINNVIHKITFAAKKHIVYGKGLRINRTIERINRTTTRINKTHEKTIL